MASSGDYVYQVRAHYAKNLPKADTLGSIDSYLKIKYPNGVTTPKSVVKKNDYNPSYKYSFAPMRTNKGDITVEVWDDDLGKDELAGTVTVSAADFHKGGPTSKKLFPIQVTKAVKSKGDATISLSVGAVLNKDKLRELVVDRVPQAKDFPSSGPIYIPLSQPLDGLVLVIEYEKDGRVDVKLWETKPYHKEKKLVGLRFDGPIKYKLRRQTWDSPQTYGPFSIYAETKLDDVPLYKPLDKLQIYVANEVIHQKMNEVTAHHGWTGSFTYEQAKTFLTDKVANDKEQAIYLVTEHGLLKSDWDSSNSDIAHIASLKAFTEGYTFDISHESTSKRSHLFFGKPKTFEKLQGAMRASIDDLPYPVYHSQITLVVYKRDESIPPLSVLQVAPFYG